MRRILSLDPGETTGWCKLDLSVASIQAGEMEDWKDLQSMIDSFRPDVIVMESFKLYPWASKHLAWSAFVPVEVIGVAKFLAYQRRIPVVLQSASQGKSLKLKLTRPEVRTRHEKDAFSHVLVYLRNQKLLPALLATWRQNGRDV